MLDEAVGYIAQDSLAAAHRLLIQALDAAASLATLGERGRRAPELEDPNTRELFVQRYRLIYEVHRTEVHILAFLHDGCDCSGSDSAPCHDPPPTEQNRAAQPALAAR
ncbi:MAG: type II toxin-antitoxin system RelE/ParE family toxin [Acidobacteria bacterium]|nr:type II toxin-antitoxin system RelE/ParE family toxin [Acidobacteriota bacterium]